VYVTWRCLCIIAHIEMKKCEIGMDRERIKNKNKINWDDLNLCKFIY